MCRMLRSAAARSAELSRARPIPLPRWFLATPIGPSQLGLVAPTAANPAISLSCVLQIISNPLEDDLKTSSLSIAQETVKFFSMKSRALSRFSGDTSAI